MHTMNAILSNRMFCSSGISGDGVACGLAVEVCDGVAEAAVELEGVGFGESDGVNAGDGVGAGEGVAVGDGSGDGDGEGVAVGDGEGVTADSGRFPMGIINRGIIAVGKLRMLRSVWAPFPFHVSNPLATKLAVRFTVEASSRICWATHPASTRTNSCDRAPPSPLLPAELSATRKMAGAVAAHIWLSQALAISLRLSPDWTKLTE